MACNDVTQSKRDPTCGSNSARKLQVGNTVTRIIKMSVTHTLREIVDGLN